MTALIARVQDSLLGGLQGRVSITPLGKPNALLLIGWGDAVRAAKELITRLDQPVSADAQFKVFPLRHAPANGARTTVQEIFASRTGLASRVQVSADVRTNSLLVQASPRDMVEAEAIIQNLDRGESASVNQTRIYKLKNTLASDLATTLQAAIAASRGGSATSPATTATATGGKSSTLELVTVDPSGRKVLKSGILADVQITADPHLNTLIISAPAESIELVVALIQQLDVPVATAQIKVFRILNGDASRHGPDAPLAAVLRPETGTTAAPLPLSQDESTLAPLAVLRRHANQQHHCRGRRLRPANRRSPPLATRPAGRGRTQERRLPPEERARHGRRHPPSTNSSAASVPCTRPPRA